MNKNSIIVWRLLKINIVLWIRNGFLKKRKDENLMSIFIPIHVNFVKMAVILFRNQLMVYFIFLSNYDNLNSHQFAWSIE